MFKKIPYETKNISRAAEILYISQPAVSHNIKELEKQLNIQLFYKKVKRMSFTYITDIWKMENIVNMRK